MVAIVERIRMTTVQKFNSLWLAGVLSICVIFISIGGGYAFGGDKAAAAPKHLIFFKETFPHSVHAHGWIMFILGLGMVLIIGASINGFTERTCILGRWILLAALVYSFWSFWAFLGGIIVNSEYSPTMWWYLSTSIIAGALASLPPPIMRGR